MPTDCPPSWEGGRNYQSGSITGMPYLLQGGKIEDAKDTSLKHIDTRSTVMVCQPWGRNFFEKWIIKGSPSDGNKLRRITRIELGLLSLLLPRKIENGKNASKKNIDSFVTVCQLEAKEFEKGIVNGSSSDGSETNNTASPAAREDPTLKFKFASRDLKSVSLLGKGFAGIVYETIWKEELRCARKDFVRVPSATFERETKKLVRLGDHINVVQTFGWAVAKICCSLVLELMDCSLRSLVQRRKLLRRVTSSEPHEDTSSTLDSGLDSGCSNPTKILLIPQQEIEKKTKDSHSPVSASCEAQTSYPFSILEVIQIITAIAAGMKFLHDNEVAHGDLKPGNILVTLKKSAGSSNSFDDSLAFTTVKVADFGVIESKSMARCMTSVSLETRELDRTRRKAPKLFDIDHVLKQDFDALAMGDIYSFGITAWEILSGEEPYPDYQNSCVKALQELILKGTRPKLPDRCQLLHGLIRRCWDCTPTKRPSFGSILEELEKIRVALSVEEKSRIAMWPASHVLESSSTKGLDDQLSWEDHSLIKHSSTNVLEMVH